MERYLDIDQPDDEQKKRLRDMAIQHPVMQQLAVMQYLMERAQSGDDAIATAAQMTIQQLMGGGVPGGGQQPGPEALPLERLVRLLRRFRSLWQKHLTRTTNYLSKFPTSQI